MYDEDRSTNLLEIVDGQQSLVGLFLCVMNEVNIHKLLHLEMSAHDIFDDTREKFFYVLSFAHHLYDTTRCPIRKRVVSCIHILNC